MNEHLNSESSSFNAAVPNSKRRRRSSKSNPNLSI